MPPPLPLLSTDFNEEMTQLPSTEPTTDHKIIVKALWALTELPPLPAASSSTSPSDESELNRTAAGAAVLLETARDGLLHCTNWPTGSLAAALEALCRLGINDEELITPLLSALTQRVLQSQRSATLSTTSFHIQPESNKNNNSGGDVGVTTMVKIYSALSQLRHHRAPELLSALAAKLATTSDPFHALPPPAVHRLVHSLKSLEWPLRAEALQSLGRVFFNYYRLFPCHFAADVVWMLARRGNADEALLTSCAPAVHASLSGCSMKHLADISRAYAKAPHAAADTGLFDAIAARAAACVDAADPQDIARVVAAFDQVGMQPEALLDVVEAWADRRLAALSPQALTLALVSFAKLGNHSPRLLQTAATCVQNKLQDLQRPELAMVLWSFARLEFDPGEGLLRHAEHAAVTAPAGFADREMANTLWSLARLGHQPSLSSLKAIAAGLLPVAHRYSGLSASLVLWAFATFGKRPVGQLIEALGGAVAREAHSLDAQSISLTAWALGTLGYRHAGFGRAVTAEVMMVSGRLDGFLPQNLANLGWGLAKSGIDPGAMFMIQLEQASVDRLHEFSPQELFCLCWTFATLRYSAGAELAIAAATEFRERATEFGTLEFSGMLWALARMLRPHPGSFSLWTGSSGTTFESRRRSFLLENGAVAGSLSAPLAATWVLAVADRELPMNLYAMEMSQLAMTVWGMGRLIQGLEFAFLDHQNDDVHDEDQEEEKMCKNSFYGPAPGTFEALREVLFHTAPYLPNAYLTSVVEGLSWMSLDSGTENETEWSEIFEALGNRAMLLAPHLFAWEFSSLAFHLTCIGQLEAAAFVLQHGDIEKISQKLTPKGAILVLAAIAACSECSFAPELLATARRRLKNLAATYEIDDWHLELLHLALNSLPPQYAQQIKLSKYWKARVGIAIAEIAAERLEKQKRREYYLNRGGS